MVPVVRLDPKTLSQFPSFSNVPLPRLRRLVAAMGIWKFARRERIYARSTPSRDLHILLRGVAKLGGLNKRGEPLLVALVRPGEAFGISAVSSDAVHQFQCEALTDCVVAKIESQRFTEIMLGVSLADFQIVMGMVGARSRELVTRYSMMLHLGVRDRLLMVFAELGARFGIHDARGISLSIQLTHQDLADLVGATRPIITLQLGDLEHDGAIIREGRRLILVPQRLTGEAIDPHPQVFEEPRMSSARARS